MQFMLTQVSGGTHAYCGGGSILHLTQSPPSGTEAVKPTPAASPVPECLAPPCVLKLDVGSVGHTLLAPTRAGPAPSSKFLSLFSHQPSFMTREGSVTNFLIPKESTRFSIGGQD